MTWVRFGRRLPGWNQPLLCVVELPLTLVLRQNP
jgi:hypothetical protein